MISHKWLWGVNSPINAKLVTSVTTNRSVSRHPIGWSFWHTSSRSGCGLQPIGWISSDHDFMSFLRRFTLHAIFFFVAWLCPLELDISLIISCSKLVFIKSFCPCNVSFFLDPLETLQKCMSTSFLRLLIILPAFGYICMYKHFSTIK